MAKSDIIPVNVSILGKEFQVASPEDEHQQLLQAATFLDKRMREIRESGKVLGIERIAVMAALNLSYELLNKSDTNPEQISIINNKMQQLSDKIESSLDSSKQIELTNG
ncbi:cell division protein ZapA [Kangiella sp. HZ709]|uniref:cell division protein ZapA n=1 Tax=Kangiella sp. HZ709 TaxID=2666328 RepID=UPI0012AEE9D2|nr:cell division protein ZapA [Kangiella sp. HZ709]MRX28070.1 cell division protein ZapA [Kangiella sp. HZ709]